MGLLVVLAKGIMLMMFGDLFLEDLLVLTSHLGLHILYKSNGFHPLMAIRRSAFSRWKKFLHAKKPRSILATRWSSVPTSQHFNQPRLAAGNNVRHVSNASPASN